MTHDEINNEAAERLMAYVAAAIAAATHFNALVEVLSVDNWCDFEVTPDQARRGHSAIAKMIAAGCTFPSDQIVAMNDLDSAYWVLAAGEESEMAAVFARYDGFGELQVVLNEIFESPAVERETEGLPS